MALLGAVAFAAAGGGGRLQAAVPPRSGDVYSFGDNGSGQLGVAVDVGSTTFQHELVEIPGKTGTVTQVAVGDSHSLVLTSTGQVYAMGENNFGQLGVATNSGATTANSTPALVSLPGQTGTVTQIAAGANHSLAVTSTGELYAWGDNQYGQLGSKAGYGATTANPTPAIVRMANADGTPTKVPLRVTEAAAGANHTLVVSTTGHVYAFGANDFAELGSSTSVSSTPTPTPVTLPGESGPVTQVAAGQDYSFALTSTGQLYAWGDNSYGQLGAGTVQNDVATPVLVSLPGENGMVTQVAAGGGQTLVVTASGQLYTFGRNSYGQLGDSGNLGSGRATPTLVTLSAGTGPVVQVAAGGTSSLALTATGRLYGFGINYEGQLGLTTGFGTATPNPVPTLLTLGGGATAETIARGSNARHALIVLSQLAVAAPSLPADRVGTPYNGQAATATGGIPPYTWSATGLPAGLSITADGRITGTPTAAGGASVVLKVTDADAITASSAPLTLTITRSTTTTTTTTTTSTTSTSTTTSGSSTSAAELRAGLRSQLVPRGRGARISALLKTGRYVGSFRALGKTTLTIDWYERPKNSHAAPVLLAAGRRTFAAAGVRSITITLTSAGRAYLKSRHSAKLIARGTLTTAAHVTATKTFGLE